MSTWAYRVNCHRSFQNKKLIFKNSKQIFYYVTDGPFSGSRRPEEIQYLDLDLESDSSLQSPKSPERVQHQASSTVYKTVDFIKTDAFNRTRLTVEECRYKKAQ